MRRCFCWFVHWVVIHWPFSCYDGVGGRIFFWLLPWAGDWAHYWSEPLEYRQQLDSLERNT